MMFRTHFGRIVPFLIPALAAVFAAGCRGKSYEDYMPPPDQARAAVEAALSAWKGGQKPGRIETSGRPVLAVDCQWSAGRKLEGYRILGEVQGEGPPCFAARLTLAGGSEQTVRYYVLGLDPHWVFRQEDYDMMTHWDCPKDQK
jgi:hypothetical protein